MTCKRSSIYNLRWIFFGRKTIKNEFYGSKNLFDKIYWLSNADFKKFLPQKSQPDCQKNPVYILTCQETWQNIKTSYLWTNNCSNKSQESWIEKINFDFLKSNRNIWFCVTNPKNRYILRNITHYAKYAFVTHHLWFLYIGQKQRF